MCRSSRTVIAVLILLGCAARADVTSTTQPAPAGILCLGKSLMPAWGFHRNGERYGGTLPLDESSAWTPAGGRHVLTWVAEFPTSGDYQVWVRRFGGYGDVEVCVNDMPVTGGRGGPGGGKYVWRHLGAAHVDAAGQRHVDIAVTGTMFDAVLFTTDSQLDPQSGAALPKPVADPKTDSPRAYRDDAALGNDARFVVGGLKPYEIYRYDWAPSKQELIDKIETWAGADQYVAATFGVRALDEAAEFRVALSELSGPGGATIGPNDVDVRVVHVRTRRVYGADAAGARFMPQLLLRDARDQALPPKGAQGGFGGNQCTTRIGAHESRQFWITVRIPTAAPVGLYRGTVTLKAWDDPKRQAQLPFTVEVLDVDLKPADGYFVIFHTAQPVDPNLSTFGDNNYVTPKRYLAELQDMVRHGMNSAPMYSSVAQLPYLKQAGMTRAPCLMAFPRGREKQEMEAAKEAGFDGLLYYGYDEPREPARIEKCRLEAISRRERGLSMMTAINSREAYDALWDLVDHPIYSMWGFAKPQEKLMDKVKAKGFQPICYWTVGPTWPLQTRIFAGPYHVACGFVGTSAWSYRDFQDKRQYEGDDAHGVSYPDEFGDPIPTLDWEAYRDGIDDLRYVQSLDRAIAAAKNASSPALAAAKELRRRQDESMQHPSFQHICGVNPGDLDQVRRETADTIVALRKENAHDRALAVVLVTLMSIPLTTFAADNHWKIGVGCYGGTSGEQDMWSGFTDLDRARMDWIFILYGTENTSAKEFNRLLKINPNLKAMVRFWPISNLGLPENKGRATFVDYLYGDGVKEKLLAETSRQIHLILDGNDKPDNVVGFTFLEELPMHFTVDEFWSADTKLPSTAEHYRKQVEAEYGKKLEKFDEPLRRWWAGKFVQAVNEINAHIKKESGGKLVFAYLQTNHRTLDWLEPGESIVNPIILPFHWKDVIKPGVADGFFAYANNKVIWDNYLKLARDNDWLFFSQLAATPLRLCSWPDALAMSKVNDPHNLGYFFYSEGYDRTGEWNDDTTIPPDQNFRRHSVRYRCRQHAAQEKVGMEIVNANLKPEVKAEYDLRDEKQRYSAITVIIRNVRDRSWYLTPEEAALRDVKVSLTLPPGLTLEPRVSVPSTISIDRVEEMDVRTVCFWATRAGKVELDENHPIQVTVEPAGVPAQVVSLATASSRIEPPKFRDVGRSGEFWHYPILRGAALGQTRVTFECLQEHATMPAVTLGNGDGVSKIVYMGTLRSGQRVEIGPGLKASLFEKDNPSGRDVSDKLGGRPLTLSAYSLNRLVYEDIDPPTAAPRLRISVKSDGVE